MSLELLDLVFLSVNFQTVLSLSDVLIRLKLCHAHFHLLDLPEHRLVVTLSLLDLIDFSFEMDDEEIFLLGSQTNS